MNGKTNAMFIILAHQRSGTHLLASLLNSHPDLTCYDEVLLGPGKKKPLGWKRLSKLTENEGAIVMYSHLIKTSLEDAMIVRRSKLIHLVRNDVKAHGISLFKKSGIEFDEKRFRRTKRRIARYRAQAMSYPFEDIYTITYEEISGGKNIKEYENKELLKFLGVKPMKLTTNIKKGEI